MALTHDVESRAPSEEVGKRPSVDDGKTEVSAGKQARAGGWRGMLDILEKRQDVELRGCTPVPYDQRKETDYFSIFTLWFCVSCNPLPYVLSHGPRTSTMALI